MKKIITLVITMLALAGCSTNDRYLMLSHTGKFYEATNSDCPKVEILADKSINCYTEDLTFIRHEKSVSEGEVRQYRATRDAKRDAIRNRRAGERALSNRSFNPNSPRI